MSRNRKKIKSKVVKTAAVMGALVLAASPIIPCVGSLGVGVMSVSAAYEATAKVMKVDFQNMEAKAVNIQKTTGTISDEKWVVDASNNGKLQSRGSDAQFNNGTKITIPVYLHFFPLIRFWISSTDGSWRSSSSGRLLVI